MTKLTVSMAVYGELYSLMEKQGLSLNNGQPLTIEKGTAVMPPIDFRMAALRQNCLEAASVAYIPPTKNDFNVQDDAKFIEFCESIFQWCLNGVKEPEQKSETKSKIKPVIPTKSGW